MALKFVYSFVKWNKLCLFRLDCVCRKEWAVLWWIAVKFWRTRGDFHTKHNK